MLVQTIPGSCDLLALAAAHPERYPGLLESVAAGPATARYDLLFATTGETLRCERPDDGFFARLDAALAQDGAAARSDDAGAALPFQGGWLLFASYELAGACEPRLRLPATPEPLPLAIALRCPVAVIVDHQQRTTSLVGESGAAALLSQVRADLSAAPLPVTAPGADEVAAIAVHEDAPESYLDGVARIHRYLAEGDTFQVNLSRGWRAELPSSITPARLYARLRQANPAPFAGLFQWDGHAVLSSSPERLVSVRGERVETRPIAGTRPRLAGDDELARIRELVGHPKERAEHIMLIDLERNDLGRVCVPGSVAVDELMAVETYTHVHHLVSNVSGRLRPGTRASEVIRAVFPGGTITGCPKVRCMEIIAELEGVGRGPYTGALGYLDARGDLDLNILIRSFWQHDGRVRFRAGSGIVADSIAERELDETRAKARGLLRALGHDG